MTTDVVTAPSTSSRQEAETILKSSKKSLLPIVNDKQGEARLEVLAEVSTGWRDVDCMKHGCKEIDLHHPSLFEVVRLYSGAA
jgi:CBS domain-containing protein